MVFGVLERLHKEINDSVLQFNQVLDTCQSCFFSPSEPRNELPWKEKQPLSTICVQDRIYLETLTHFMFRTAL